MTGFGSGTARAPRPAGNLAGAGRHPSAWLVGLPSILVVLIAYVWFVSIGTWTRWPGHSTYYDQLATAFAHGQLHLEAVPDAAILALEDPYDPAAREGLPILPDASLYGGKYYLYFGPVPALMLVFVKEFLPSILGDQHLAFVFTSCVFLMLSLLALELWRRFTPNTPAWIVAFCLLVLGLISPFTWILSNRAAVHDAAISAGQLFFLTGLYASLRALDHTRGAAVWGAVAGVSWAMSLGSRITQVLPVVFVALLWMSAQLAYARREAATRRLPGSILAMAIPMLLGVMALSWYNWARFGSIVETGIRYQLALLPLQRYEEDVFAVKYTLQNIYNYLLMPPKVRYNFPYLWPQMGVRSPILPSISLSPLYFAENITGLVFTAPFLLFAFVPFASRRMRPTGAMAESVRRTQLSWLLSALGGSSLLGFGFFLVFFWASGRYLLDFLPPGLLLAVFGFWQLYVRLRSQSTARAFAVILGIGLGTVSVLVSTLLAIALNADFYRQLNPVLWMQLNNVFRP